MNKVISRVFLMLLLAAFVLAGCRHSAQAAAQASSQSDSAVSSENTESASEKNGQAPTNLSVIEIVDQGGRTVQVPAADSLERFYPLGSPELIMAYTLNPEKLIAIPTPFSEEAKPYVSEHVWALPSYGTTSGGGGGSINYEALINADMQLLLKMSTSEITESDIENADNIQAQTNIPVVLLDASMERSAEAYRLLGKILGEEERGEQLAAYCDDVLQNVVSKAAAIDEQDRVRVYYAEGPKGLATEPERSSNAYVFKLAGAHNVAIIGGEIKGSGQSPVSLEQVIEWNPETIISWDDGFGGAYSKIKSDPNWKNIDAVKNQQVYAVPYLPFNWVDRPRSVNRFIGVQWVTNLLYPKVYSVDIVETTQNFYKMFYHVELSREDVEQELLARSLKK